MLIKINVVWVMQVAAKILEDAAMGKVHKVQKVRKTRLLSIVWINMLTESLGHHYKTVYRSYPQADSLNLSIYWEVMSLPV